jgi:hypothetical protein
MTHNSNSKLFYYTDSTGLADLKQGSLALNSDWTLLEPYVSFMNYHQSRVAPVTEQEMLKGFEKEYKKLPDTIRGLLPFEEFLKQRDKLEPNVKAEILKSRGEVTQGYVSERRNQTSFLRLFHTATSDYGWQTIANGFKGICFELSSRAKCFAPVKGQPSLLNPVQYGASHSLSATKIDPVPGVFHDTEENKARGEWRYICPTPSNGRLKLAKHDIEKIYVSVNAEPEFVEAIRSLIQLDLRYRNCVLYEVYPDAVHWRLTARSI